MGVSIPATPHQYELGQLMRIDELNRIFCMIKLNEFNSELHQVEAETPSEERDHKIIQIETLKLEVLRILNECHRSFLSCTKIPSPIDISRSPITFEHRASFSERMKALTLSRNTLIEGQTVESQINQLVSFVFEQEDSSSLISKDQINAMTLQINQALESDKEVQIVGSLLTLPLVKVLHPVTRSDEAISETLMAESDQYCVLTEEELGGIFFGFEARTMQQEPITDADESTEFSMSNPPQISFICEGASPALGASFKTLSLWRSYNRWKDAIQADPQGGRPMRNKYIPLRDALNQCTNNAAYSG
jgi:hypothetical protein